MTSAQDRIDLLFDPCDSKDELVWHIKAFLKIELPSQIVDEDSTISPADFVWQIYNTLMTNEGLTNHVVAASRNTAKTLTSAILHFYAMIHFRRSCLHIAATYDQSVSCINYLDKFLRIPEMLPYASTDNARLKSLDNMPGNRFTRRDSAVLRIAIASAKGSNSQRCNFLILDELDLVPQKIVSEVMGTSDPTPEGFEPVSVCLSSRKTNDGPVQKFMDDSTDPINGIQLHKWSLVDWMHKCPTDTHKPELPRKKALLNLNSLAVIWDEDHQKDLEQRGTISQYKEIEAYSGCEKCPAFVTCQARSPKQTSKTKMLRSIRFVGDMMRKVRDADVWISQYLNLRSSNSGQVFKMFTRTQHVKDPAEFYTWTTGRRFNPKGLDDEEYEAALKSRAWIDKQSIMPTKNDTYHAMLSTGWDFSYGVDFGYNPAVATCIIAAYHKRSDRAVVFYVEYASGYDNRAWAEYISTNIWPKYEANFVAPDVEDPASPSYFGKYKIPTINTKPHQISSGVSQLRGFLWNVGAQSSNFAILDDATEDSGNKRMIEAFEKWQHKKLPTGHDYARFEDDNYCDFIDPLRYSLAPYVKNIKTTLSAGQPKDSALDRYNAEKINLLDPSKRGAALETLARGEFDNFFKDNFGLEHIFDKQKQMAEWTAAQELNKRLGGKTLSNFPTDEDLTGQKHQKKSGIKMSF